MLINENTMVSSLVSREEVQASEMDEFVSKTFQGSIPQFLTAFTKRHDLRKEDVDLLRKMIEDYKN